MSRYVLTLFPDGKALITVERDILPHEAEMIREQFERWRASDVGVAVMTDTRVQHATSIEIELPDPVAA